MDNIDTEIREAMNKYFQACADLYRLFDKGKEWRERPFDDCTEYYWGLTYGGNVVFFRKSEDGEIDEDYTYSNEVLRTPNIAGNYTLLTLATGCDNNQFLSIFDNTKQYTTEQLENELGY